jgi:hypothetical protein
VTKKHFVGKETDIAQCACKCCNATIVDVSRLRVNPLFLKFVGVKAKLSLPILRRYMCSGGIAQLILILHTSAVSFTLRPFCLRGGKVINSRLRGP